MSASLANSADRLPACRIAVRWRAGSPPAASGWQPDIHTITSFFWKYLGLQKIPDRGILMIPLPEI